MGSARLPSRLAAFLSTASFLDGLQHWSRSFAPGKASWGAREKLVVSRGLEFDEKKRSVQGLPAGPSGLLVFSSRVGKGLMGEGLGVW